MPSYKYGARVFGITIPQQLQSTAANVQGGGVAYLPSSKYSGVSDLTPEHINGAALYFPASIASAATTAAGGSLQVQLFQYNSAGSSVNSAVLYNQAAGSQAAHSELDVSTLCPWTLSIGDHLELLIASNTVGVPVWGGCIFSCTVDAGTAS